MSDFAFEQPGNVEPVAPEPVPSEPVSEPRSPSAVTAQFAATAAALRDGAPVEASPPAAVERVEPAPPVAEPALDQQAAINEWLSAQLEERAQERAQELVDAELASLYELFPPELVDQVIAQLPAETQQAIAGRHEHYVEAVEYGELLAEEAAVEAANATVEEGVARLHELVDSWQAEQPGLPPVDVAAVWELALERWPEAAAVVDSPEVAEHVLKSAFDELATNRDGELRAFALLEQEARLRGVELDVVQTKALADQLFPEIAKRVADPTEAAHAALRAAADLQTNFAGPASPRAVTNYYAAKARALRTANGETIGGPPARTPELSLPHLTTLQYAAQAAAIRARGGQ